MHSSGSYFSELSLLSAGDFQIVHPPTLPSRAQDVTRDLERIICIVYGSVHCLADAGAGVKKCSRWWPGRSRELISTRATLFLQLPYLNNGKSHLCSRESSGQCCAGSFGRRELIVCLLLRLLTLKMSFNKRGIFQELISKWSGATCYKVRKTEMSVADARERLGFHFGARGILWNLEAFSIEILPHPPCPP